MKRLLLLIMMVALLGAACGDPAVIPEVETDPATETDEGIFPRPTVTPDAADVDESYPVPALVTPGTGSDYPAPEAMPTLDPYPVVEGYVWVIHPVGEQCEDGRTYENVDAAVSALEAAEIEVQRGTTTNLLVCLACGCPTSEHYRLHIAEDDLPQAEALGWELFRDGEG